MKRRTRLHLEALEDRCLLSFSPAVNYAVGLHPQAVATADFNNDSRLDLVTANEGNNSVSVRLGNGDGTFQNAVNYATGAEPLSLAVGDFDGDLDLDLATANRYDVSVLLGNGNGTFQPTSPLDFGFPTAVAVGDFNGDSLPDLGLTVQSDYYYDFEYGGYVYGGGSYAGVLLGDGAGGFSGANFAFLSDGFHYTAAAADFNADGIDDFATAGGVTVSDGTVSVLLGDFSGSLQGPTDFNTGYFSYGVAAGDLDGDGDSDLVAANVYGNNVSVLLGDGAGGFGAAQYYAAGYGAGRVALADFNHDTHLDIVTANYSGHSASVLLGRGDGAFTPPVNNSAVGAYPWSVTAGDFDGDGWLDAATANYYGNNVSVLINDHAWIPADAPSVSIGDVTVTEGNAGTVNATLTVTLSAAYSQSVTVNYSTANGTATSGSDYVAKSGTLTFAPGETTKTITVAVLGDQMYEPNETFVVNLSGATNATIGDGNGLGTIVNDDTYVKPSISIGDISMVEGRGGTRLFTFTVSLSVQSATAVTVNYSTANGTATALDDYTAASGTLTFAPGETTKTITIKVKGDRKREGAETFFVNLFGVSSNATILDAQGIGTILNDD